MTLPVLICDDSALARKQLARSLPADWDVSISFAENGQQAISAIKAGKADLLFLDLNMPVMNGYEVLERIRAEDLPCMVMVVSGDVQQEARTRVMAQGALDFMKKPVSPQQVSEVLRRFGIISDSSSVEPPPAPPRSQTHPTTELDGADFIAALREVINIAMGQAGGHLGKLLGTFIQLPVPEVFFTTYSKICRHLSYADGTPLSAVSHGFSGNGVAGEGILLLPTENFPSLGEMMTLDLPEGSNSETGILTDLSELLVGSCLKGVSQLLDIEFNHSYPALLGHRNECSALLDCDENAQNVLAINITYHLESPDLACHLLLLFTEDSVPALKGRVDLLVTDQTNHSKMDRAE